MAQDFDPYYRWLGIPPEEQPPDFYRLLGVQPFERDADVIQNAADRQMLHVRTFQNGPHAAQSQKLLTEIAAARMCLMNAERKAAYDRELFAEQYRRATEALEAEAPTAPVAAATEREVEPVQPRIAPIPMTFEPTALSATSLSDGSDGRSAPESRGAARKPTANRAIREIAGVVGGGLAGIIIAMCILWYGFGSDPLGVMEELAPRSQSNSIGDTQRREDTNTEGASNEPPLSPPPQVLSQDKTRASAPANQVTTSQSPRVAFNQPPPRQTPAPPAVVPTSTVLGGPSSKRLPQSPSPRPQPPAGPQNPFTRLPAHASLALVGGPFELGVVTPMDVEKWQVTLFTGFADLGGQYEFALAQATSASPQQVGWPIHLRPRSGGAAPEAGVAVARLFVEGDRLKFEWLGDAELALRPQLLNAVLTLSVRDYRCDMAFRRPEVQGPVVLDLEKGAMTVPLNVATLPARETLVLRVERLEQFPAGTQVAPAGSELRVGERLGITIPGGSADSNAEMEVQFTATSDAPDVRIRSWYRSGNRREELSKENVGAEAAVLQRRIAEDQRELQVAQAAQASLESSLSQLARRTTSDAAEAARMRAQANVLQNQLTKARSTIRRATNAIPKTQAALQQLQTVANLGNQLHQKARLHLRLSAVSGDRELTLAQLGQ